MVTTRPLGHPAGEAPDRLAAAPPAGSVATGRLRRGPARTAAGIPVRDRTRPGGPRLPLQYDRRRRAPHRVPPPPGPLGAPPAARRSVLPDPAALTAAVGRAAGRRPVQVLGCLVAAAWAACFPLVSQLPNQRTWGLIAAAAYLAAAAAVALLPSRSAGRVAAGVAVAGAAVLPLVLLALEGHRQSEVFVVERSADLLLHTGSPYLPHPVHVTDYNPYLPAMALFGLPRALLGGAGGTVGDGPGGLLGLLGDARLWFATGFLLCMVGTWRLLRPAGRERGSGLALAALTASPLVALPLAVGGVDLPLIGVCCLGLALAARGRPVAAGLVLAFAFALKWTAWPAAPVALVLLRTLYGNRAALRAALAGAAATAVAVAPFLLWQPQVLLEQVVRFPLGLSRVRTPAGSPLPGKLLADLGPAGHLASLLLLCLCGTAVAVLLLRRPPLTAVQAADLLALGLSLAFLLAPAGRFGYLALPAVLALWPRLASARGHSPTGAAPAVSTVTDRPSESLTPLAT